MAGYSGTPLAKKLGLSVGARAIALGAPPAFRGQLDPLPEKVRFARVLEGEFDVVVLFARTSRGFERELSLAAGHLKPAAGLWVAWPKKSSGIVTDMEFDRVQKAGLALGLVDNKVCAIDEVWSGLRFVIRRENRTRATR